MKRLIRDKRTKKFLTVTGSWTTDVSAAEDFGNIELVIRDEQHHSLTDVELLMVLEDEPSSYDIVLPLGNGQFPKIPKERKRSDQPKSQL